MNETEARTGLMESCSSLALPAFCPEKTQEEGFHQLPAPSP